MFVDGEGCYLGARDEARAVVASGKNLYSIFSFGTDTDKSNDYLGELVDYAYNSPGIKANKRFYADNVPDDWENYAKIIIWYGRRNKKTIRNIERISLN